MSNMIPFESSKLPAYLARSAVSNSDLMSHSSGGFPVLSIKGKVFTLVKSQERTVITRPDDPEEAATALEVVILRANPNLSKVFYTKGYEEGASGKPDCYSNDGIKPAADSTAPQCKTCAACAKNVWGTGLNGKGFACQSSRRIAIASPSQLNEPMLLRIPPATLSPLTDYAKMLENRGVGYSAVITKLRFDRDEATPKLTFTPVGFLSEDQFEEAQRVAKTEQVENIIGRGAGAPVEPSAAPKVVSTPAPVDDDELAAAVAPAKKPTEEDDAPAPKKAKAPLAAADDEDERPARPAPTKVKAAKVELADDLDALLSSFDD